jgi:LemA protein
MTLLAELSQNAIIWLSVGGAALLFFFYLVAIYNALVALRNQYKNSYAQIDVQLKRRYDLIPNLVETAKGYMKHERETLEAVIAARNQAAGAGQKAAANPGDPNAMQGLIGAEGALRGAMGRLFAVMESYPDLKANQNMLQVQEELTSTENKVSFARQAYNDSVMAYNTKRETFPDLIVARLANFTEAKAFEIENPTEREAPKVKFT